MRALSLAVALAAAVPAEAAGEDVTIGIYRYAPPAALTIRGVEGFGIAEGRLGFRGVPGGEVRLVAEGGRVVAIARGRRLAAGPALFLRGEGPWALRPDGGAFRRYAGRLAVRAERGKLLPLVSLPLETYLESAVADEMPPDWPPAALEAQAVAARTYARAERHRHRAEGFDFCDLTHCQLFRGLAGRDGRVDAAVRRSAGRVLRHAGRVATTPWHSTCGGYLAPNTAIFGGSARPYLAGGPDLRPDGRAWCQASPHFPAWSASYSREALERALRASGRLRAQERLDDLRVSDRLASGYTTAVTVAGSPRRPLTGYALWMALGPHFGWGEVKSPAFGIARTAAGFRFTGRGLGHGVGMCQWGARGRAEAGHPAARILEAYFPGTTLSR